MDHKCGPLIRAAIRHKRTQEKRESNESRVSSLDHGNRFEFPRGLNVDFLIGQKLRGRHPQFLLFAINCSKHISNIYIYIFQSLRSLIFRDFMKFETTSNDLCLLYFYYSSSIQIFNLVSFVPLSKNRTVFKTQTV